MMRRFLFDVFASWLSALLGFYVGALYHLRFAGTSIAVEPFVSGVVVGLLCVSLCMVGVGLLARPRSASPQGDIDG